MNNRWRGHGSWWLGLGEGGWGEPLSRGDLWAGSWNMRFVCLFVSVKYRDKEKNSRKSTGHESVQGNPVPGVTSAALEGSSRYSQSCWLRWRGEQERVGDSQRNFMKHLFYVIFHFIKCLYGFISLHLPLVHSDNICTLQTAMWKFILLGKQVSLFLNPKNMNWLNYFAASKCGI